MYVQFIINTHLKSGQSLNFNSSIKNSGLGYSTSHPVYTKLTRLIPDSRDFEDDVAVELGALQATAKIDRQLDPRAQQLVHIASQVEHEVLRRTGEFGFRSSLNSVSLLLTL